MALEQTDEKMFLRERQTVSLLCCLTRGASQAAFSETPSPRSTSSLGADQSLAAASPAFQVSTRVFAFSLFLSGVEKASDRAF